MALMAWKTIPPEGALDSTSVDAEALKREEERALFFTKLSSYLRGLWETAKRAKVNQENRMVKYLRARNGEYEPSKLAAIREVMGGNHDPIFMKVTETKCRAAEAWIKDMVFVPGHRPFELEPTPIPELPQEMESQIEQSVVEALAQEITQNAAMTGQMMTPDQMNQAFQLAMPMMREKIDLEIKKAAKKAAVYMTEKISDQFAESRWDKEVSKSIYDLVTFGSAPFKGPCLRKSKIWTRKLNPMTGTYESVEEDRTIPKFERINPFDWYPSPDAVHDNIMWSFQRMRLSRKQISDLIGVDGFKESEVRAVLQEFGTGGLREWTNIDQQKADLEGRDSISIWASELVDCLEYAGTASGKMLLDWGLTELEVPDADKEYNIIAWLVGRHVIRCVLNPDVGNYIFVAGFSVQPDTVWHKGIPELMEHIQTLANACARSIVHNVGVAAGPQVEVNVDRLDPSETVAVWPWKVWKTTSTGMMEAPAVKFWQPNIVTQRLLEVYQFCLSAADDDTGIPRYMHTGETPAGGAGDTASGLSMLMGHASKGVKLVVRNLDEGIIIPSVESQYRYNLRYEGDDDKIVGDLRGVARGSTAMIAKEQQVVRTIEMLDRTNNPTDLQLIGLRGRAELMRPALAGIGVDVDKVLGDEEEIEERAMAMGQAPAPGMPGGDMRMGQGSDIEATRELDEAGNPVTGKDTGTFSSPEGSTP